MHAGVPRRAWEHPFVSAWAVDWRDRLYKCSSLQEWMHDFDVFVSDLFQSWNLPIVSCNHANVDDEFNTLLTVKLPTTVHGVPPLLPNPKDTRWDADGQRLWIQVDNQQVSKVFEGLSRLECDEVRPNCVHIGEMLWLLLQNMWRPRVDTSPFVEWDTRDHNAIADHAANIALDQGTDWVYSDGTQFVFPDRVCVRLCSDGALRKSGRASAEICVFMYDVSYQPSMICRAGRQLGTASSAFVAEVLAFEWALSSCFTDVWIQCIKH